MKIDSDNIVYIQDKDLATIKERALQEFLFFGGKNSDNLMSKSYFSSVFNFLVSKGLIDNRVIKFGELDDQPNIK